MNGVFPRGIFYPIGALILFVVWGALLAEGCGNQPAYERTNGSVLERHDSGDIVEPDNDLGELPDEKMMAGEAEQDSTSKRSQPVRKGEGFSRLYRHFAKPAQSYLLSTKRDTIFSCAEGTIIGIKAGSFVSAITGEPIVGDVLLEVKEFYRASDIILANLTTKSGEHMLETGGMIHLAATSDGKECRLKESATVKLGFPYEERKEGMQLFTGIESVNGVDWKPVNNLLGTIFVIKASDSLAAGSSIAVEEVPITPEDLPSELENAIVRPDPSVKMPSTIREPEPRSVTRQSTANNSTPTVASQSTTNSSVPQTDIEWASSYAMKTSNLGWINCDRFYPNSAPRIDFVVNPETSERLDVKLIFHSIKSVMPGDRRGEGFRFKNVPVDQVVTVVALKSVGEEYQVAVKQTKTTTGEISGLVFQPVTFKELRKMIEEIAQS